MKFQRTFLTYSQMVAFCVYHVSLCIETYFTRLFISPNLFIAIKTLAVVKIELGQSIHIKLIVLVCHLVRVDYIGLGTVVIQTDK